MKDSEVRAMAKAIFGRDNPRGVDQRSWVFDARMSEAQAKRLGRRDMPACFDSEEQWVSWCIREATRPVESRNSFCHDCQACYKNQMVEQGRCEYPNVVFKRPANAPDEIVGDRYVAPRAERKRKAVA